MGKFGIFEWITLVVVMLAVFMTIYSGVEYIVKNISVFKDEKEGD